ncbi:MAG: putative colanic acid biosynthesis acetyltransferase [Bacteroidales bacterium]|nr:putative colanic acid biosynthesis acetyltransferase [Bacteroidales bacterium]MBD5228990.1 putative colanic acid biosynthesis acetyltransferase [Bacteroidales bacterium]MBD5235283.1 putative colanic acid biosynthesis acetyltransferase [Barnesiella sp.]MBD5247251.1 putative colanic acid biosynthesis acetyltransferase [Barnesiella sp.]MBD5257148.1 putative colanic acid biosynthesis acetyltransferase [Barnesiella sp.]
MEEKYLDYKNQLSLNNKIGRLLWNITYIFLFRPFALNIFWGWRKLLLKLFGAKIGKNCCVHASAKIWAPWLLIMEDNSCMDSHVNCYNVNYVTICSWAIVSKGSYLCPGTHDITSRKHEMISSPIVIGPKVWVAVEAFIGPGVQIGEGAVVGARACVFKNVEPWTIVGGNPAKPLKKRVFTH